MAGGRIEAARARARGAKLALGAVATVVLGVAFVGAKAHAAGHTKHRARPLAAPRSFERAVRRSVLAGGQIAPPVLVDPALGAGVVRLSGLLLGRHPGLRLDLNGVVKALAVDEAVSTLDGPGFVSAVGDLAVRGPVDVGLPGGGAVRVVEGGLATSGTAASLHGIFAGTDRSAAWLAVVYGLSIATIVSLVAWRIGGGSLRPARIATAGAVGVVLMPVLLLGPLQKRPLAWNAARVSERLTGQVIRNGTDLKQIVSFVGDARSPQKLLVRADLLVSPRRLDATSLQLEYLPSGDVCRGRVTQVGLTGFAGVCHLPDGSRRVVQAGWVAAESGVDGTIRLHA